MKSVTSRLFPVCVEKQGATSGGSQNLILTFVGDKREVDRMTRALAQWPSRKCVVLTAAEPATKKPAKKK